MKIKKIVDMCRREGVVRIYTDGYGVQWISNGYACYPLYDVPELSEDEFFTVFDFTEKQRNETVFQRSEMPGTLSTADFADVEELCEKLSPSIPYGSRLLVPYEVNGGVKFIDSEFLAPLADESGKIEVYERVSGKGAPYFVIKAGMCLRAIIMPFNAINQAFVNNLGKVYSLCKDALISKSAEEAVQIGAFDSEDD